MTVPQKKIGLLLECGMCVWRGKDHVLFKMWLWLVSNGFWQAAPLPSFQYCIPPLNLLVVHSTGPYWPTFTLNVVKKHMESHYYLAATVHVTGVYRQTVSIELKELNLFFKNQELPKIHCNFCTAKIKFWFSSFLVLYRRDMLLLLMPYSSCSAFFESVGTWTTTAPFTQPVQCWFNGPLTCLAGLFTQHGLGGPSCTANNLPSEVVLEPGQKWSQGQATLVWMGDPAGWVRGRHSFWQRGNKLHRLKQNCNRTGIYVCFTLLSVFPPFICSVIISLIVCCWGWIVFKGHESINFRKKRKTIFITVRTFLLNFSIELNCVKETEEWA